MKIISYIGITILLLFAYAYFGGYQSPRYVKIAHKITAKTAKKIEQQKKLRLIGTGGGMMDDIQAMHMSFQFFHEVDLKKARELVVFAIKQYLEDINSHEKVRPYLHNYPFTAKNIEIHIWVYNPDRTKLPPDKIYYISAINGVLNYYIRGPEEYSRQAICEQTYEEALENLSSQSIL